MQAWERSRCTSACRFIFARSVIVLPQVWHWYFKGPPSSTRAIIDSSNAFKSIMRFISYRLWGLRGNFWEYCVCNRPRIITKKRQVGFDFLINFISLVLCICPGGHNIIGMISGIVGWESIPCLEALCADNARVADIKVHFCVSPHFVLVVLQAADRAPPLALATSFNHWLQCRI